MEALALVLPTLWEVYDDRHGENKKGKTKDLVIVAVLYVVIALAFWWLFETHPLKSLALMLGIRILIFDYMIVWVLRKNGVITPNAKVFTYVGKTSTLDTNKFWIKIGPWGRFAVRIISICAASYVYLRLPV